MAENEEWSANANEALSISLVTPSPTGPQPFATFHPRFTYPIFGDDERIFGYKDLNVNLRFRSNDMRPHVKITHRQKFKTVGATEATDIVSILKEHLPQVAFSSDADFVAGTIDALNWTPTGQLHATVTSAGETYEIWKGCLSDPAVHQMVSRLQVFVPLFIEGGSYIGKGPGKEPDDLDRWTVFFLYRTETRQGSVSKSYTFVGYATVYRFYFYQPPTPPASPANAWELPKGDFDLAELPCKSRLSQFIILPPFQNKGNGPALYKTIYDYYLKHAQTKEFTVEDPNEAFDDLRDLCDLSFLRTLPEFHELRINTAVQLPKTGLIPKDIVAQEALKSLRQKTKIAPRQFSRVVEMHLMSTLPPSIRPHLPTEEVANKPTAADRHQYRLWQVFVKQRLYRHNKDMLGQLDLEERLEKLGETLSNVEFEYIRLLAADSRRSKKADAANGKRKLGEDGEAHPAKRIRFAGFQDEN